MHCDSHEASRAAGAVYGALIPVAAQLISDAWPDGFVAAIAGTAAEPLTEVLIRN
jgi:hypothetical protein